MPKQTHLHRRSGSSSYYFRCRIPADLLSHYAPRTEIVRSLRTSDYKEALKRVKLEALTQDAEFEAVRQRLKQEVRTELSEAEVERFAALIEHGMLRADEEIRQDGVNEFLFQRMGEEEQERIATLRQALARGDTDSVVDRVDDWLQGHGIRLERGTPAYRKLAYAMLKGMVTATEKQIARHDGYVIHTPPAPGPFVPSPAGAEDGPTLRHIFEKWKEERKPASKSVADCETQVRRFEELHGVLPVSRVTKAHVRDFKEAMLRFPASLPRRKPMTVPQILGAVEKTPETQRLSPRTVQEKCLAFLKTLFAFAVNNGYLENDPSQGINVAVGKVQEDPRLPYSIADLNVIFRFPVYTSSERPTAGGGEAAKWLPLLALFSGARLEELGQLLVDDVKEAEGIHYLDMTTIEEGKQLKTLSSKRRVPVHPELARLGFLDYVEERRQAGDARLFPALSSNQEKVTASWSKWWGRYARRHGITDKRKVFHSFRHTVKAAFRETEVDEAVFDALQGHAPTSEGRKYGRAAGFPLKRLAEGMAALRYPGLDLKHLLPGD